MTRRLQLGKLLLRNDQAPLKVLEAINLQMYFGRALGVSNPGYCFMGTKKHVWFKFILTLLYGKKSWLEMVCNGELTPMNWDVGAIHIYIYTYLLLWLVDLLLITYNWNCSPKTVVLKYYLFGMIGFVVLWHEHVRSYWSFFGAIWESTHGMGAPQNQPC